MINHDKSPFSPCGVTISDHWPTLAATGPEGVDPPSWVASSGRAGSPSDRPGQDHPDIKI